MRCGNSDALRVCEQSIVVIGRENYADLTEMSVADENEVETMQTIHAVFQNDGKWFVARCLSYPVTTQGRTLAAAKKNLKEAVELYLETWGGSKPPATARDRKSTRLNSSHGKLSRMPSSA